MDVLLWIVAVVLIVAGLVGTVLPALPGTALAFVGILLGAWIDGFTRVSHWTVAICSVLMLLAWAADFVSATLGAKRAGASRLAIAGAAIGTVAGLFTGLVGLLVLPLVGAAIGEFFADRDAARAARVGAATWIGLMLGTIVKVVITFAMVGLFVAALLVR
jgi:uncharacterized protein YqgC (DUF456 family)